jgi:transposase
VSWAQVWDLPPIALEKVHYLLRVGMRLLREDHHRGVAVGGRRQRDLRDNVNAAAILLASEGNVLLERTAMLMATLLGTPVSTRFVARALERFAQRLAAGGFEDAMKRRCAPRTCCALMKPPPT